MSYFFRNRLMKAFQNERWDESKITRGKTTPESNSGSFAPSGGSMRLDEVARDALADAVDAGDPDGPVEDHGPAPEWYQNYLDSMAARGHLPASVASAGARNTETAPVGEGYKELQLSRAYKPPEKVQVGAILYRSWGYGQTNVNFYEVTGMSPSGKTVTLRELRQIDVTQTSGGGRGSMAGKTRALPGAYTGDKPFTKRVNPDGKGTGFNSYSRLSLWSGKDEHYSWGH